jgi:PAS domain-containing protein
VADILNALEQEKEIQFYREVKIKDRIFGEVLYLTPQFDSVRIYANDITERRRAEEALIHSEEYFRLVTDNALDVLSIIEADGTIRYGSTSTEQVLGYRPEDLKILI